MNKSPKLSWPDGKPVNHYKLTILTNKTIEPEYRYHKYKDPQHVQLEGSPDVWRPNEVHRYLLHATVDDKEFTIQRTVYYNELMCNIIEEMYYAKDINDKCEFLLHAHIVESGVFNKVLGYISHARYSIKPKDK